jgi:hypothetical protein
MFYKRATRHIGWAAALLPLLLASTGSARALYRCIYDNVARAECCCPSTAAAAQPSRTTLSKASCCDIERPRATTRSHARVERSELAQLRAPNAVLPVPRLLSAALGAMVEARRMSAALSPPIGPPLLLLKRSFLI